jgi:hypothetical protein
MFDVTTDADQPLAELGVRVAPAIGRDEVGKSVESRRNMLVQGSQPTSKTEDPLQWIENEATRHHIGDRHEELVLRENAVLVFVDKEAIVGLCEDRPPEA